MLNDDDVDDFDYVDDGGVMGINMIVIMLMTKSGVLKANEAMTILVMIDIEAED